MTKNLLGTSTLEIFLVNMNCILYRFGFVLKVKSQIGEIYRKQYVLSVRISSYYDFGTIQLYNGAPLFNIIYLHSLKKMSHY